MRTPALVFVALVVLISAIHAAQQEPAAAFDVVSIRPTTTPTEIALLRTNQPGRVDATGITARDLILRAYDLQTYELLDGPSWIERDRFDIAAKTEALSRAPVTVLLQSLLASRFGLVVRRERRDIDGYSLVFTRADQRPGPALTRSREECAADGHPLKPQPGIPVLPATLKQGVITGCRLIRTPGWIMGAGQPMSTFARTLTQHLGRPVIDHTGSTEPFDFHLSYLPDSRPGVSDLPAEFPDIDPNAPTLFTALQEQLGLKLQPGKVAVPVVAIVRIEHPSEN